MKNTSILSAFIILLLSGCGSNKDSFKEQDVEKRDYRNDMRSFVIALSKYAKTENPNFSIIPQNGIELVTDTGDAEGKPSKAYLEAIDGNGQEGLLYGYEGDNDASPINITTYFTDRLKVSQQAGNSIFIIDYCSSEKKIINSHETNYGLDFIPFVATERNLTTIPAINPSLYKENNADITTLKDAKNFLFFLNYEKYDSKAALIEEISNTNHDVVFMDMFFNDNTPFSKLTIEQLKTKASGGKRLVISYMSIGEAEDYRYYWKDEWNSTKPEWLDTENTRWPGNFKVKYWNKEWQNVIFGTKDSYLDRALLSNYDGVYLDIIDAFEYYENK